jgi:hypothetical protein
VSDIDVTEEVKQEQLKRNIYAKFIRFGDTMMSIADFIQSWQHRSKGTEKDLFYGVELNGPPVPKQVHFTFTDEGVRINTNKGELPLRSLLIEVEIMDQTIRVPPARIYRYADENNQLAQGVDFIFPDCTPIIVSIIKYDSGEFKLRIQHDGERFKGRQYVVIQPPEEGESTS